MTNKTTKKETQKKNISFKVDEKLHKKITKYCAKNNITLKDLLINYMEDLTKPVPRGAKKLDIKDK